MSVLILSFISLLCIIFITVTLLFQRHSSKKLIQERLKSIHHTSNEGETEESSLAGKEEQPLSDYLGKLLERYRFAQTITLLILHAGSKASVGSIALTSVGLAAAGGFLGHIFLKQIPLVLLAVIVGGGFPYAMLLFKKSKRLTMFNTALPDALTLMARALRAGHSLASSMEIIAEQSPQPLGGEFENCYQQQKFGIPFRDALLQMGERMPSKDLKFFITAVLVQRETGGDLTDILDRTSRLIQDRVRIANEIRTYTAQGRLTGWVLGFLPIVILAIINVITPGYSHVLFDDPLGQKLLYAGGTLIVIGSLIIRKIVDIKV